MDERFGCDPGGPQRIRSAEVGQVDHEQRMVDHRAGLAQQLGAGERRAAGGDQVVDQQHALTRVDRARVALEYGAARIELDPDAIAQGERVLLVDDLIATGGTALAGAELLRQAGAVVDRALFVIDLPDLGGADALRAAGIGAEALIDFPGH